MNSVGYCVTLGPQLRDDEALVVENAIRLAVDSIVNVLFGVNSSRAREYHRVLSDRDKEIQRLETRLRETEEELEVLRQLGCGCGGNGTQRSLGRSPSSGDLRVAGQSGPEAVCEDSEEPEQQQQQQHCEMTLTLGLYAEPPAHVSPPDMESALHPSQSRRMEKETSHAFAPSGMSCDRNVPPSAGAPLVVKEEPHDINSVLIKWEMNEDGAQVPPESTHSASVANVESGDGTHFGEIPHVDVQALRMNTSEQISKTLVLVRCRQQLMYVTLEEADEHFDFHRFNEQVVEKFHLPPDSKILYKDDTGTEVDADVFSHFISLGNPAVTVFPDHDASDGFTAPPSDTCDSAFSLNVQTVPEEQIPRKRRRDEEPVLAKQLQTGQLDFSRAVTSSSGNSSSWQSWHLLPYKNLVESVLKDNYSGLRILSEYTKTETLTNASRRQMVNILVAHMINKHGYFPAKTTREQYALGIVMLFPSLRDPYSSTGYQHFYDAKSGTGYISWRLKTVQRRTRQLSGISTHNSTNLSWGGPKESFYAAESGAGYMSRRLKTVQRRINQRSGLGPHKPREASCGGPNLQRTVDVKEQLEGVACEEALSLLRLTTEHQVVFQKMRETFQHRQSLVNGPDTSTDVLSVFPRFLDTKGLVDQDFTLLFDEQTSSMLLHKWDVLFKPNVIREAKRLVFTTELHRLLRSAESPSGSELHEGTDFDEEMSSLLLLLHLLPPPAAGPRSPKISVCDAVERLVVFQKSCSSLEEEEPLHKQHLHLLAVGRLKSSIDRFYVVLDRHLIPCRSHHALGALDELFKAHFVFNVSYDAALRNFYTFLQTTVYNIDVGTTKESPRLREIRARLLNQHAVSPTE
ncbi:uncharacterized protein LOC114478550 isoform X2 [Gouania willdenowi]|uniref:uncharacterized protein LOC114478550 isoform X2 n=1 Tax=Gouania willdenowi TaxID=441366 RepID=UPI001054276A|nr:uncharacterized protein LOC114478550 isoform X2 [Gouania willdenowi]